MCTSENYFSRTPIGLTLLGQRILSFCRHRLFIVLSPSRHLRQNIHKNHNHNLSKPQQQEREILFSVMFPTGRLLLSGINKIKFL
jgi:hypothetical protein